MSYDLYFHPRALMPSRSEVLGWLNGQAGVSISPTQAVYENPDTGVYFSFDFYGKAALPSFNINYSRPHVFGLEAADVLADFVEAFQLEVEDPQFEGMGRGLFTREGFLRGWSHGNRSGVDVMKAMGQLEGALTLPSATLEGLWRWNRCRRAHQDWSGTIEARWCFIPSILLLQHPDDPSRVCTGVLWGEAMSVALPAVDLVVVIEERGAQPHVLELSAIEDLLEGYEAVSASEGFTLDGRSWTFGVDHRLLDFEDPPEDLMAELLRRGRPVLPPKVPLDAVLTRELVDEVVAG